MSPVPEANGHRTEALLASGSSEGDEMIAQTHALIYVGDEVARLADAVEDACKIGGALDRRIRRNAERGSAGT